MNKFQSAILISLVLLCCHSLGAQELIQARVSKPKIGFISGYGSQDLLDVNYDYRVIFFQPQLYLDLIKKPTWSLELLLQPQYNLTTFREFDYLPDESEGFEFGLNVGVLARKNFLKDMFSIYLLVSLGPHYVSGVPKRQSPGFIFSDNLLAGLTIRINKQIHLDLRPGIRHISNAGLSDRNGGVNNMVFSGGFLFTLEQ